MTVDKENDLVYWELWSKSREGEGLEMLDSIKSKESERSLDGRRGGI